MGILTFNIINGDVQFTSFAGWQSRPYTIKCMIEYVVSTKFKNSSSIQPITINIHDACDLQANINDKFFFAISGDKHHKHRLFPDPYSLSWPEINQKVSSVTCKNIFENGLNQPIYHQAFWSGSPSHSSRNKIHELSQQNPHRITAFIFNQKDNYEPNKWINMEDMPKYKYLIDAQGQGWSARLKYLMFSNRPLFVIERKEWDWVTCDTIPFVHYIPVKEDVSDLLDKLSWADNHPEEARQIATNALIYIKKKFTKSNIHKRVEDIIRQSVIHKNIPWFLRVFVFNSFIFISFSKIFHYLF